MQIHKKGRFTVWHFATALALDLMSCCGTATADGGQGESFVDQWHLKGYYENDTRNREVTGLSKFRNTIRLDGKRVFENSVGPVNSLSLTFKLRATYDGVYDLNAGRYGKDAGGSICLQSTATNSCSQWGQGAFGNDPHNVGVFSGLPTHLGQFGFDTTKNPNTGMIVLGQPLHGQDGGVAFGVPVRPCNVDNRGCLPGYLNSSESGLRYSDFNGRQDWLRELYLSGSVDLSEDQSMFIRLGRQQVVWGRTDLFRVLDVVNPVDYSRNNIYDELQDIRIPMWILTDEYRMGPVGFFQDLNWQVVWNFDKFRPDGIGQCGSANVILDAGCFFRGMKNLWDNGGTVSNFAPNPPIVSGPQAGLLATDFGPHQIGIRNAELPPWRLSNSQIGTKFEGVLGGVSFSLNGLYFRSQLPSLHGGTTGPKAVSPFANFLLPVGLPLPGGVVPGLYSTTPQQYPYLIAFDIHFPRVMLAGGSMDFTIPQLKTAVSVESAVTWGEEFPDTLQPSLYKKSRVARYVLRADRLTFIPWLNPDRTFVISGQVFGQHLLDHEQAQRQFGSVGMPDWKQNWIATLLIQGFYHSDQIQPQIIAAHDFRAQANTVQPSLIWLLSGGQIKVQFGGNIKFGEGAQKFDDARSTNPYPPFTVYNGNIGAQPGSLGLGGFEPLGRFRSGPLGASHKETEAFITLSYQFL